jgi:hypothetical protein
MVKLHNSATTGAKTHARTPVVLLLPNDLKRLVHYVRTVIERHSDTATHVADGSFSSDERDPQSRLNVSSEN